MPLDDGIAIDAQKKKKKEIITDPNRLHLASDRIKKNYFRQKSRGVLKKSNKKTATWLKGQLPRH